MRQRRGFTLLEMLVVIVLIGVIGTAVSVSVMNSLEGAKVRNAGKQLMAALRYTRGEAIIKGEPAELVLDTENNRYEFPGPESPIDIPEVLDVKLLTASNLARGEGRGAIRFFPDGSSTGGRVTLAVGQRRWIVGVVWLTGEVNLSDEA